MKDPFLFWFGLLLVLGCMVNVGIGIVLMHEGWTGKSLWSDDYDIRTEQEREITEEEATRWATNSLAIRDSTNIQSFRNWYRTDGRVLRFNPTNQTWYEIRKWKENNQ